MSISKSIQDAIKTIVEQAIKVAPFDKTRTGIIKGIDVDTDTYFVQVDGVTYSKIRANNGVKPSVGDTVSVIVPTNNPSQMAINGTGNQNWIMGMSNILYPVGRFIWTSDADFDPNTVYAGEWEQSNEGSALMTNTYCWHRIS